jgi:dimethylhistidine N-methyltransferase
MIPQDDQEILVRKTARKSFEEQFLKEVKAGLTSKQKKLISKYFYDKNGDKLFQRITKLPEYYLTRCELDIFENKAEELATAIGREPFDLIELGAGDGTKSYHLLHYLLGQPAEFTFMPIDISGNILNILNQDLQQRLPGIDIQCLEGEYFETLARAVKHSSRRKVVLLLGGNIGNMEVEETAEFCLALYKNLGPGDRLIIGFDLKKHPQIILNAYNDSKGVTATFNINLLSRINRELAGDFDLEQFEHYQSYDPQTGECRSHLVSLVTQSVFLDGTTIEFKKNETIFMEISRKFSLSDIEELAHRSGSVSTGHLLDSKEWFTDSA